ncbi:helix-turn-helix domain-containing protein [Arsenicicoccus sp. oral taxon 190]|uniref:helix-turn-helix domain-containing protein n=1 Tax=Arsenicicoccus sp. oral taxon 190 TaxID=1658671 RepID=UPI00155D999C|nr:helix-turn-helix transcriptional regulator [Arsenicicoccus sp. oral taxon 190]
MSFAARLRQARLEAGLSQADLGGDEFTVSYVSHLEAGRREPSARVTATFERRLDLPRGYLAGGDWGRPRHEEHATVVSTADLAALVSGVTRARSTSDDADVAALARQTADLALRQDRPEVWWAMSLAEVRALVSMGAYAAAARTATALTTHPWVQSHPSLLAEAHTTASRTHRRAVDRTAATHHAHAALAATQDLGDPGLRAEAVIAALATRTMPADGLVAELETLHHRLGPCHLAGLVAWTIGNEAFNAGDTDAGLAWHRRASEQLNPDVDHRNWARFLSATVLQRVRHHVDEDLVELFAVGRQHLARLGTTEELADLARTEAQWHVQSDRAEQAVTVLDDAFRLTDLTDLAEGRLRLARAEAHAAAGHRDEATTDALAAARQLTLEGDEPAARQAWQLHDEVTRA